MNDKPAKPRIVIADPDWEDFEKVVDAIIDFDADLVWSRTPQEALEHIRAGASIMVADWAMKMPDGEPLFAALRRESFLPLHRTIVVAAPDDLEAHIGAFELGADDVLTRPFNHTMFRARVGAGLRLLQADVERLELQRREQLHATITTVAHEINNPLFAVMGNLEMLREELEARNVSTQDEFLTECLDAMKSECARIADVVNRLRKIIDPKLTTYHGRTRMVELPEEDGETR